MRPSCFSIRRGGYWVLYLILACISTGCGSSSSTLPQTYPVKGTVHYQDRSPVVGGAIEFAGVSDSSFSVSGEIGEDGSFTLYTVKGSEKVRGAPEGTYKVTVHPPIQADHRPVLAIELPTTYRVEAKENTFAFEVSTAKKKQ